VQLYQASVKEFGRFIFGTGGEEGEDLCHFWAEEVCQSPHIKQDESPF